MSGGRSYTYIILRYRHDPLGGELANVGVLLHQAATNFLDIRVRKTVGRLSAMFPGLNGEALKETLRSLERATKALAKREVSGLFGSISDAGRFARSVMPDDDTSFIWGPVGSGLTSDPTQTLDRLFAKFVSRYDEKSVARRLDADVWKPVRERLVERNIADQLQAVVIRSDLDEVTFDHAWKNGAWHCFQPLSFDLLTGESIREKASTWAGQLLALKDASEPFKPHFVVGGPTDHKLADDYRKAIGILKLGPGDPEVVEEGAIDGLVDALVLQIEMAKGLNTRVLV